MKLKVSGASGASRMMLLVAMVFCLVATAVAKDQNQTLEHLNDAGTTESSVIITMATMVSLKQG